MEIHLASDLFDCVKKFRAWRKRSHFLRLPMSSYDYLDRYLGVHALREAGVIPYGHIYQYLDETEYPYSYLRYYVVGNFGIENLPDYQERQILGAFLVRELPPSLDSARELSYGSATYSGGVVYGTPIMATIRADAVSNSVGYIITYPAHSSWPNFEPAVPAPQTTDTTRDILQQWADELRRAQGRAYGPNSTTAQSNVPVPGESQPGERAAPVGSGGNSSNR